MTAPTDPLLVDAPTAARLLALSPRMLWSLEKRGAVPSRRVGRRVLFARVELETWVTAGCPTAPNAGDGVRRAARKGARP